MSNNPSLIAAQKIFNRYNDIIEKDYVTIYSPVTTPVKNKSSSNAKIKVPPTVKIKSSPNVNNNNNNNNYNKVRQSPKITQQPQIKTHISSTPNVIDPNRAASLAHQKLKDLDSYTWDNDLYYYNNYYMINKQQSNNTNNSNNSLPNLKLESSKTNESSTSTITADIIPTHNKNKIDRLKKKFFHLRNGNNSFDNDYIFLNQLKFNSSNENIIDLSMDPNNNNLDPNEVVKFKRSMRSNDVLSNKSKLNHKQRLKQKQKNLELQRTLKLQNQLGTSLHKQNRKKLHKIEKKRISFQSSSNNQDRNKNLYDLDLNDDSDSESYSDSADSFSSEDTMTSSDMYYDSSKQSHHHNHLNNDGKSLDLQLDALLLDDPTTITRKRDKIKRKLKRTTHIHSLSYIHPTRNSLSFENLTNSQNSKQNNFKIKNRNNSSNSLILKNSNSNQSTEKNLTSSNLNSPNINSNIFDDDQPWKSNENIGFITEKERKRYESIWITNRYSKLNLLDWYSNVLSQDNSQTNYTIPKDGLMLNLIVKDIWQRSNLSNDILMEIYNLVDTRKDGTLTRQSFIIGMWLIDQSLYGKKLPQYVDQYIWDSVNSYVMNALQSTNLIAYNKYKKKIMKDEMKIIKKELKREKEREREKEKEKEREREKEKRQSLIN
ncbi:hypothetical protein TBLA_0C02840 [Henningerozyma blattae CBS 6284]|uniref:EH domain-containing protein n=1 Tax=Henningerozyma blattae (strain ATCC 34711 / CBS 6284 / DSM 70876 / NBRC 10599 / NRRL Y-10934 / UCD 77-7) TaxID=1071380 RepID=I2H138_HENB6|nr:hypothetical protein TBLA_0C02840 [Tetrapisispora blattae CBS 6284]CCH60090.1 hypothetical protein TBLA_0C02840 [Tetrapisispora blattae CBS 6284]